MSQPPIPDRLKKCFEAGDVISLFPLLKDWSREELAALLVDLEAYEVAATSALEEGYGKEALKAGNFLSAKRSKVLDEAKAEADMNIVMICSEIYSVALHYLEGENAKA